MAVSEFERQCFAVLDDQRLLEEDQVDKLEELVREKYPNAGPKQLQKIAMDIMWRHTDPSYGSSEPVSRVVKVQDVQGTQIDIPNLERRLKLERQQQELDALTIVKQNRQKKIQAEKEREEREYEELLQKTNDLRKELYGDKERTQVTHSSPMDHVSSFFNGAVSRHRINQALRTTGYSVLDAVELIIGQLKREQEEDDASERKPFFDLKNKKNMPICSFLVKTGSCLRADCPFSHDVERRVCSFWLNSRCVAGDKCMFKHSLDDLDTLTSAPQTANDQLNTSTSTEELFPPLSSSSSGSKPKFNASTPSFTPSKISTIPTFVPSPTSGSNAISILKPLRKPKVIPWESTEPVHKNYITHRNAALKFESQRKKFAQQSTDAWRTNDGARSKQLSDKANKCEQKCFDALKLADDELYNYSESTNDEVWFEFHGLEFNEAVEQLESSLKEVKHKSKTQSKTVYLVVPAIGYDHSMYKKTTKPITLWLDHEGYRWQLFGCGGGQYGSVIGIDPWSK